MTTTPFTIFITPTVVVSQRVPPRGQEDSLMCGEACAAMVIGTMRGSEMMPTPDEIAQRMGAEGRVTNAQQLQSYLSGVWHIGSVAPATDSLNGLMFYIWRSLMNGRLCLLTQQFSPEHPTPHWRVVYGLTDTTVYLADPWDGSVKTQTYKQCWDEHNALGVNAQFLAIQK
ncbi:MAG: C39 family peptidase [Acidobacteria bacterium]|nr:C39 family peptidase [Acidobacteriota bacterium]